MGDIILIILLVLAAGWALSACLRKKGGSGGCGSCSGGCGCSCGSGCSKCPGKK